MLIVIIILLAYSDVIKYRLDIQSAAKVIRKRISKLEIDLTVFHTIASTYIYIYIYIIAQFYILSIVEILNNIDNYVINCCTKTNMNPNKRLKQYFCIVYFKL